MAARKNARKRAQPHGRLIDRGEDVTSTRLRPESGLPTLRSLIGPGAVASMTMLAVLSWPAWPASAQAVYGSVAGSVSDSTGAGVPGARVTLRSLERNTVDTVVSGPSGYYLKERLLPGRYEARAELTGFKQVLISSFVV